MTAHIGTLRRLPVGGQGHLFDRLRLSRIPSSISVSRTRRRSCQQIPLLQVGLDDVRYFL